MNPALITEGLRMFKRKMRVACAGFEKYPGTDHTICNAIIDDCWNAEKQYFQTSAKKDSNYPEFYARDFGMCAEALCNIGHAQRVIKTLEYAAAKYRAQGAITVLITPKGKCINFPDIYSPDSVAYFFRSLRIAKARKIIVAYHAFLNAEIAKFEQKVIDESRGIVRRAQFSGMRDHAIVYASCYDMIMACMLSSEIEKINRMMSKTVLVNTLKKYPLQKNLLKYYWNGNYFRNSPDDDTLTAHCNVFPYWLSVITDRQMMRQSIKAIQNGGLDQPFPLRYEKGKGSGKFIWQEFFVQGWEADAHWTFLAMPYIKVLAMIAPSSAQDALHQYTQLIAAHHAFIEVYTRNKKPYSSPFFAAETRMLWAAMYLDLKKEIERYHRR